LETPALLDIYFQEKSAHGFKVCLTIGAKIHLTPLVNGNANGNKKLKHLIIYKSEKS
jgi:hypothetical protein